MEYEGGGDVDCNWGTWDNPQRICRRLGIKRTREDNPDCSIVKIGQNTEKRSGDMRRFAVTIVGVKNFKRDKIMTSYIKTKIANIQ